MKSNKDFRSDLEDGILAQHTVATRLMKAGLTVHVPIAEYSGREWAQKDIDVVVGHTSPIVLEIKSRRRMGFTDAASYDYPTVFVDAVHKWGLKEVKPAWYVIVNQANDAMVCIDGSSNEHWVEREVYDRASQQKIRVYEVSSTFLLNFEDMVERITTEEELLPNWNGLKSANK